MSGPDGNLLVANAQDYFHHIVSGNYYALKKEPVNICNCFNVAITLYHMKDWVFKTDLKRFEEIGGCRFPKVWLFEEYLGRTVDGFKSIRDVANASKHVVLDRRRQTEMNSSSDLQLSPSAHGTGLYGKGRYSGPNPVIRMPGEDVNFDQVTKKVFEFWLNHYPPTS